MLLLKSYFFAENVLVPCNFQYDIVEVDGVKYASIIDGKCEYTAEKVTNTFENMDGMCICRLFMSIPTTALSKTSHVKLILFY